MTSSEKTCQTSLGGQADKPGAPGVLSEDSPPNVLVELMLGE